MPPEADSPITFRPVMRGDLPMLAEWMGRPHWLEWWGEPETELDYIREMIDGRDDTEPFIFAVDGVEQGYIQVWRIASNRVEPWLTEAPWLMWLPDNAVGVDLSLADLRSCRAGWARRCCGPLWRGSGRGVRQKSSLIGPGKPAGGAGP